ncbi:MAG: hypothetical protein ACK5O2_02075 [Microthrixaceae bacterium]
MNLEPVRERTAELAAAIGPIDTLVAMARLEDALGELDRVVSEELEWDELTIDLRDTNAVLVDLSDVRGVLEEAKPVLDRAEVRIRDMASALSGS